MTRTHHTSIQLIRPFRLAAVAMFALFAFLLTCAPAFAQLSGKGQIRGTVTDSTGAAVPGATIVVTNTSTNVSATTTSTSAGDYSFPTLDPANYTVNVTAAGFQKLTQQNVQVNALETQTVNPTLTIGSTNETVEVTAAPPQLETSNATLGATMENEMYSSLPIEMGAYGNPDQRRATDFAFLMPGVQGNNTTGNPTTNTGIVNGSGSRGGVTSVYIDGVNFVRAGGNGDPRFVWTAISVDAVNQFQLQTTGYSSLYEGQGVQNYTIKQGGNKYHVSIYEFFRNTALDAWGFYVSNNPLTGLPQKPIERQNEYGINISGPLIPFGSLKDKLFFFGNYNGYRYASTKPNPITFPNVAEQQGNFQGALNSNTGAELSQATITQTAVVNGVVTTTIIPAPGLYDPSTQTACTANSTNGPCRYRYGFVAGAGSGAFGNPVLGPGGAAAVDVIPASQFSVIALALQKNIPALSNQGFQNNYIAPNPTALTNWSHTERIDYNISQKDVLSFMAAIGRQASSVPVGQAVGSGRNVAGIPYNYGQAYAPKTAVGIIEETHIFGPHVVNQLKYGYARYDGPTINADNNAGYGAAQEGITGLPGGQISTAFPIVTFSGTNAPTNWAGATASSAIAQNYTLVDNVNWILGKHSLTIGGQLAWMLYNNIPAFTGSTPITLANSPNETGGFNASSNSKPSYAITSNTGVAYASFLVGQIDKVSYSTYLNQDFGSRFLAKSPYVQDNWKVSNKLTLDVGVRYDIWPSFREAHDSWSFFNPTVTNPITGTPGILQFAGTGTNTCNCRTPVNNYWKNISPRLGLAYQLDNDTVLRASYAILFTHGGLVGGGSASQGGQSSNSLGFSAQPTYSASGQFLSTAPFTTTNTAIPTPPVALGRASGPSYGTGYTTVAGYTGTPSTIAYADPYLGGRSPEYVNWSLGLQHQWSQTFVSTITYVGSQGHFLAADGSNARGYWADQLDPQYLSLGGNLNLTGTALTSFCAANANVCPAAALATFNTSQSLATLLKPFPFQTVSDLVDTVANSNYNSLQVSVNMRPTHGVTLMGNYTWAHSIDDAGYFRSGYAIPAAFSGNGIAYPQDRIERSSSTSNQPHHAVITAVWDLPYPKANYLERTVLGGYRFSTIFQSYSGSPLAIVSSICNTNPAQGSMSGTVGSGSCMPNLSSSFIGSANINGGWGQGALGNGTSPSYINSSAFATNNLFQFGNAPRTHAYGLVGPGNYNLDISLRRSFHLPFSESTRLSMVAELYNVTNHTQFSIASTVVGNSSFGKVSGQLNNPRQAQLSARLEF